MFLESMEMKEAIIKYKSTKTLDALKDLGKYLGFSVYSISNNKKEKRKPGTFNALAIDTKGYHFNREEANER